MSNNGNGHLKNGHGTVASPRDMRRLDAFKFKPGYRLADKYRVGLLLGAGWEGEVYHITEEATGIERAAKLFFPARNPQNKAVNVYAKKLDVLRDCSMVIRYHTQEAIPFRGHTITALVSEYVEGEILAEYIKRQPGSRLGPFEAVHLLHTLARGIEEIHDLGEYHGDLHDLNILVRRVGLGYKMKLVDFYHWGKCTNAHREDDLCSLIRLFYDALGGAKHYQAQPAEIKYIIAGLKRSLITRRFRSVGKLRHHLESMRWE
jgi:tRNA A-37 threonylcarbamoyl transferase component Bud32